MNPLRKEPRFQEMVRRVGLPGWRKPVVSKSLWRASPLLPGSSSGLSFSCALGFSLILALCTQSPA